MDKKLLDTFVEISDKFRNFIKENNLQLYHRAHSQNESRFLKYIKKNIGSNEYLLMLYYYKDHYRDRAGDFIFGNKNEIEKTLSLAYEDLEEILIYNIKEDKEVYWKITLDE
jgi:hypothetical protein